MPSFAEEVYLREKARALSTGLRSRLGEFVEEFPSEQSHNLIATTRAFLGQIELQLVLTTDTELLRWYCRLIDELSEVLEWLDHAHTAQTPRACVNVLTEMSKNLLDGAAILVTPATESNYRISDEVPRLQKLTNALPASAQDAVLKGLPSALYRVQFPRIERDNILNHALFGHEFGHPIVEEFFDEHETKTTYQNRLKTALAEISQDPDIADDLQACSDDTERAAVMAQISDTLAQIHRRALVELVSDAVAAYVFGPSAILSAFDFFIRDSIDEVPVAEEYYPPTRYRWRLILRILEDAGHIAALRNLTFSASQYGIRDSLLSTLDYLQDSVTQESDRAGINSDSYTKVAYSWLEQTLPDALEHARTRTAPMNYESALVTQEVPALLERLQAEVPPSEVGTWPNTRPVDWRSTIVASWLLALSQSLDESMTPEDRQKSVATTHTLAMKGVEYIFLQKEYEEYEKSRKPRTG